MTSSFDDEDTFSVSVTPLSGTEETGNGLRAIIVLFLRDTRYQRDKVLG